VITELLTAIRAVPRILDCLERLADAGTVMAAQGRRDEKNEMVEDLVARAVAARDERVRGGEVQRVPRPGGGTPEGV
tara:strand:+ start:999 stop:1229 length:231 start_codon:yes stop_codon:yes gene_type:complete